MFTLYNVVSADGFIARKDGSEDFIPDSEWPNFLSECEENGSVVMGRKTYDTIQSYDAELRDPFEKLKCRKIVVSTDTNLTLRAGYELVASPEEAARLAPGALVVSGPTLNTYLLEKGMVDKIVFNIVPESIGDGIRPFDNYDNTWSKFGIQTEGIAGRRVFIPSTL